MVDTEVETKYAHLTFVAKVALIHTFNYLMF